MTLIVSKKSIDTDEKVGGKRKSKKKDQAPKEEPLLHKVEVLNYFEHVKVSPPLFTKSLQECLTILEEKKAYFKE